MKQPFYILLVCFSINVLAQDNTIDSLESIIDSKAEASVKSSVYTELAIELIPVDTIKSYNYALKAVNQCDTKSCQLTAITRICAKYRNSGRDYLSHKLLSKTNMKYVEEPDSLVAQWYYVKGVNLYRLGKKDSAALILNMCLNISEQINFEDKMAEAYNVLGHLEVDKANYSKALDHYQMALEIDKQLNDLMGMSDRYNNIGRIYQFKNEQRRSRKYTGLAIELNKELGRRADVATGYNNIGYSYKLEEKYDSALIFLRKAERIQKDELPCSYIYPIYNIGSVFTQIGKLDSAEIYLNRALKGAVNCNDKYIQALSYQDMGNLEWALNHTQTAINHYLMALQLAEEVGLNNEIRKISKSLADAYTQLKDYATANSYLLKYQELSDSIFDTRRLQELARVEAEYEYRALQKQAELERKVESLNQQNELDRSRLLLFSAIIGVISLIIILGILFYNYRKQQKSLELLKKLHSEIQRQAQELDEKTRRLEAANEEISQINESLEEKVARRTQKIENQKHKIVDYITYNSHQVRGPLARILGLVDLFNKDNENVSSIIENLKIEAAALDQMVREMNRKLEEEKK
ncbi:tetratricopeptide repeat protein [Fulvivirga lutea]|uniref:Tetratricopeptide repeat protein n=1 Tax=Fulvivirga lutea TaxID=2810512 RepID=A0A974WHT9_9BACT|nr:tetratricopeptide repeat protein [Fulvivirga lutea]QSE98164.1 tetratricopeptide repeat protein [Fulvivirga lutea]